jgi:serpin B
MKKIIFCLLITPLLFTSACGPVTKPKGVVYAQSQLTRNLDPKLDLATINALSASNTAFAFSFYNQVRDSEGNIIFSPFSLSLALSMALAGAEGNTRQEMLKALSLDELAEVDPAFNALLLAIEGSQQELQGEDEESTFQLNIANSSWGQSGFGFEQAYLDVLASQYGAGIYQVDFSSDPEAAREAINDWVEGETNDKIKDLIPKGAIKTLTRLVLANAIYFKGGWMHPFMENGTKDTPFTLLDGSKIDVEMMRMAEEDLRYAAQGDYQAVFLPYKSGDFSMLLILPDEGEFAVVEAELGVDMMTAIKEGMQFVPVNLRMPKFDFETAINANDVLQQLGMIEAFIPDGADFSGITMEDPLYISDVVHKATITVDEQGTEAAAATAVIMATKSMPISDPINLVFDRPFMYAIMHEPTGTILFLGRVVQP